MVLVFPVLLGLNFSGALGRKYYEKDDTFGEFVYSTTRFITLFALTLTGIAILFARPIADFFNAPLEVFYIAIGVSFISLYWQLYQAHLKASLQSRRFAIISFIQAFLALTLTVGLILLFADRKYRGKLWAQATIIGLLSAYSLWQLRKVEKKKWDFAHVRYALHIGVPLIPHTLSYFVLASLDRLIINQLKDATQTGMYALAYNIGSIVMIFVSALNSAWVPLLFKNLNKKSYATIERISNLYTIAVIFFALGLTLFSEEALFIMASAEYHEAFHIIPLIVLSSLFIFLYQLCVNYTFYVKKNIWVSINTLISGGVNILLNYLYIPKYGYTAAAWTTLVSYILLFTLNYLTARYFMGKKMMGFRFKLGLIFSIAGLYYLLTLVLARVGSYPARLGVRIVVMGILSTALFFLALRVKRSTPPNTL